MISRIVHSGERPQEIRILSDKVLVTSDIREIAVPNIGGNGEETTMYEYQQTEYGKDEYIGTLQERLTAAESQTTDIELALTELYEGLMK